VPVESAERCCDGCGGNVAGWVDGKVVLWKDKKMGGKLDTSYSRSLQVSLPNRLLIPIAPLFKCKPSNFAFVNNVSVVCRAKFYDFFMTQL
jgi:hypothetical protein